jgi:hypothetical protein
MVFRGDGDLEKTCLHVDIGLVDLGLCFGLGLGLGLGPAEVGTVEGRGCCFCCELAFRNAPVERGREATRKLKN